MHARIFLQIVIVSFPCSTLAVAQSPNVVELIPANEDANVDPALSELRVTFDQDMSTGLSFTGGGPRFPKTTGKPKWIDKRTCVLPVDLEPGKRYELGINAPSFRNFKSAAGVPVEPVRWTFKTRGDQTEKIDPAEQARLNRQAATELSAVLKEHYAYYDRKKIDWAARLKEFDEKLANASDTDGWARVAAELLGPSDDLHLWLECEGETYATGRRAIDPNTSPALIERQVPAFKNIGRAAAQGRYEDGIGYLLIASWSNGYANEMNAVQRAIQSMQNCKAIIVDVRPNSGGDELLARQVAAWFVTAPKVYSKNRYRDPSAPGGWGPVFDRVIEPNDPEKRFTGRVVVLIGPANMSSCESFILMMKQAPDCTLVGEKTWGSSGNPKPHKLCNDVTVYIPSWQDMLPDGTLLEGRGLEPDVKVPTTPRDFESDDSVLKRALQLVRNP